MTSAAYTDPVFVGVLVFSVIVALGLYFFIYKLSPSPTQPAPGPQPAPPRAQVRDNHVQQPQPRDDEDDSSDSEEEEPQEREVGKPKMMGKKKRAKMERKQALKEHRQYQLEQSKAAQAEEKAWIKALRKEEKEKEAKEAADEQAWQEYLRKKQEKEEQEYAYWKQGMQVESAGSGETERDILRSRKQELIGIVVRERVVLLESLASRFQTTTALIVELLTECVNQGGLEGIFDERGKFIHVSREERLRIAKIINRRGRVSITELSREANALISLEAAPEQEEQSDIHQASSSSSSS